jgi:hypothetical protein
VLLHFRSVFASRFHRVFYIVCVVFVCSYIFFDVLDLDGSNFPRLLTPTQRVFLIAETVPVVDLRDFRELAVLSDNVAHLLTDPLAKDSRHLRQTKAAGLDSARSHGYRTGLPRDSVADPTSPYH